MISEGRCCSGLRLLAVCCFLMAGSAVGQTEGGRVPALSFDVVSIRPDKSIDPPYTVGFSPGGDGFSARNMTLPYIVQFAYDFHRPDLIAGWPEWAKREGMKSERFDIEAKIAAADLGVWKKLNDDERRRVVQTMLAERFKLKVHHEQVMNPVFELVVAKGGAKVHAATPGETAPDEVKGADGAPKRGMFRTGYGQYRAQQTAMELLCLTLTDYTGRQVVDKTGLTGVYDFTLRFTPEPGYGPEGRPGKQNEGAYAPDSSGPTIFTAVQEQLGLKLEAAKQPVDGLVIDHVEEPSEN